MATANGNGGMVTEERQRNGGNQASQTGAAAHNVKFQASDNLLVSVTRVMTDATTCTALPRLAAGTALGDQAAQ